MKIDDLTYELTENNYHKKEFKKKQIVIGSTLNNENQKSINHWPRNKW